MSVSPASVPRRIGAIEPLGANARRAAGAAQGEVFEANGEVLSLAGHLEIQALADRQGDLIRRRIWRLMLLAATDALAAGDYRTHAHLLEMRALAHRYEAYERRKDARRAAMCGHTGQARGFLREGTARLDDLLTAGKDRP